MDDTDWFKCCQEHLRDIELMAEALRQQELCWERAQGCPLRNLHRGEQSSAEGYKAHDVSQNLLLILNQHLALLQLCKTRYLENRKI